MLIAGVRDFSIHGTNNNRQHLYLKCWRSLFIIYVT